MKKIKKVLETSSKVLQKNKITKKLEKRLRAFFRSLLLRYLHEERYILEKKMFPLANNKKVLLVGCEYYNKEYPLKLKNSQVWSIDINPDSAKFGAKNHIIGSVSNVNKFFKKNSLDYIFMGGVIGWGLNDLKEVNRTLRNCFDVLKKEGMLFIWWNNVPGHNQVNPRHAPNFKLFKKVKIGKYYSGFKTKDNIIIELLKK